MVFLDVTIKQTRNISVDSDLVNLILIVVAIFFIYFFSSQLQVILAKVFKKFSEKIGVYSTTKEFAYQRYVYQHSTGLLAKLYNWVNSQLIALGIKRLGVTVVGYLLFWGVVAIISSIVLTVVFDLGFGFMPVLCIMIFVISLVMTRVMVSERMEKREADVMNAIDLIIPEAPNGIKNAINTYMDNFAPSIREDFKAFSNNIQNRGYSFEDAMYILTDNLGRVFQDFAQKAIYFESVGEHEMIEVFADISETNRLRRQLRDENNAAFVTLKSNFIISVGMVGAYFMFLMFTDDFSRNFFLHETIGKVLLIIILCIVFGVLAYITTIKSNDI